MARKSKFEDDPKIHDTVAAEYGAAVAKAGQTCGGDGNVLIPTWEASFLGYSQMDFDDVPQGVESTIFGCGNPLAFADVREGQTVVDLGSGAGLDLLVAGRKVGHTGRVIGVDMTDEMIAKARQNVAAAGMSHIEVRKGYVEALPIESGTVDWLISNCVLSLSPNKHKVFAEIARVLKPGGQMSISDIVTEDLPTWARDNKELYSACISGAIGESEFLSGLRDAGLVNAEVRARLIYEASEIESMLDVSRLPPEVQDVGKRLSGKIWTANFHASKSNELGEAPAVV